MSSPSSPYEVLPTIPYETVQKNKPEVSMREETVESTNAPCCGSSFMSTNAGEDATSTESTEGTTSAEQRPITGDVLPSTFVHIPQDDLEFHECCGEGSFGSVYRCTWKSQNKEVAVKKLHQIDKEAHVLSALSHRNIIQFYGASADSPSFHIVTEYAAYGSLYAFLATPQSGKLDFVQMLSWARDIALGMNYLHSEAPVCVVHRDLKSKNIVISQDLTLKICDFGASRFLAETVVMTVTGTYPWMAPELIQGLPTCESCDVYSYGVVLWELLTREVPFKGLQGFQVAWMVAEKQERPPIPSMCPEKFAGLIQRCWQTDADERPTFGQIIQEVGNLIDDDQLNEDTNTFINSKGEWVEGVQTRMQQLQQQEHDLLSREQELKNREEKLKMWEKKLKEQMKNQSLLGVARYNKTSENLSCKFSSTGAGAVDSIKDVLSHIMSNTGLGKNSNKPKSFDRLSKIQGLSPLSIPDPTKPSTSGYKSMLDGNQKEGSNSSITSSGSLSSGCINPTRGFSFNNPGMNLPHKTKQSPITGGSSPATRMRPGRQSFSGVPTIHSDINYDKSDIKKSLDIFGTPRGASSAGTSPCEFKGLSSPLDRPSSASSGRFGKLQKQISTSSEEYQFEGSKVSLCKQRGEGSGGNMNMSEPEVNTWESATGGAKVNKTNEQFEYDPMQPGMEKHFGNSAIPMKGREASRQKYLGPSERDIEAALSNMKDPKYKNVSNSGFASALSKILEEMETKKNNENTSPINSVTSPMRCENPLEDLQEEAEEDKMRAKLPSTLKCRVLSKQTNAQKEMVSGHKERKEISTTQQTVSGNAKTLQKQRSFDTIKEKSCASKNQKEISSTSQTKSGHIKKLVKQASFDCNGEEQKQKTKSNASSSKIVSQKSGQAKEQQSFNKRHESSSGRQEIKTKSSSSQVKSASIKGIEETINPKIQQDSKPHISCRSTSTQTNDKLIEDETNKNKTQPSTKSKSKSIGIQTVKVFQKQIPNPDKNCQTDPHFLISTYSQTDEYIPTSPSIPMANVIAGSEDENILIRPQRQREILRHYYNKYYDDIAAAKVNEKEVKSNTKNPKIPEKNINKKASKTTKKPRYVKQNHERVLLLETDEAHTSSHGESEEMSGSETDGYMRVTSPVVKQKIPTSVQNNISQPSTPTSEKVGIYKRPASSSGEYMRVISPPNDRNSNNTNKTYPISNRELQNHQKSNSNIRQSGMVYQNGTKARTSNTLTARQLLTGCVEVPVLNIDVHTKSLNPKSTTIKVQHLPGSANNRPGKNISPQPASKPKFPANIEAVEIGGPGSGIYETDDFTYIIRANNKNNKCN